MSAVASMNVNTKASGRKGAVPKRQRKKKGPIQSYTSPLLTTSAPQPTTVTENSEDLSTPVSAPPVSLGSCATPYMQTGAYELHCNNNITPTTNPTFRQPQRVHRYGFQTNANPGATQPPRFLSTSSPMCQLSFLPPSTDQIYQTQSSTANPQGVSPSSVYVSSPYTLHTSQPGISTHINPSVAVPQGCPLPPKPSVITDNTSQYFITKLKGNISRCNGCQLNFQKGVAGISLDSSAVIGRKEYDWFPFIFQDGSKCWRKGRAQNHYYHINLTCLNSRNPGFEMSQLTGLVNRAHGIGFTNEILHELRCRFGETIFNNFSQP